MNHLSLIFEALVFNISSVLWWAFEWDVYKVGIRKRIKWKNKLSWIKQAFFVWGKSVFLERIIQLLLFLFSRQIVSDSLMTPRTVAHQAPQPMEFSRQENWSGCHFLLQRIFMTQGLNPYLLHCRWILYHRATWLNLISNVQIHDVWISNTIL